MSEEKEEKKTSLAHIPKVVAEASEKHSAFQDVLKNVFFDFVILFANGEYFVFAAFSKEDN